MGGSAPIITRIVEAAVTAGTSEIARGADTLVSGGSFDDYANGNGTVAEALNKVDPIKGVEHIVNDPKRAAQAAADQQQQAISRATSDRNAAAAAADASAAAIQARDDARRRARMMSKGAGQRATILTGQSGVTADTGVGRKTLLGA